MLSLSTMPTARSIGRLRRCLEDRLARIEKRLITLGGELVSSAIMEGSERHRELLRERFDLHEIAAATRKALDAINHRDSAEEIERHERSIAILLKERDAQFARSQANWERQSAWRQARLFRMAHLDVRFAIEKELGTPGLPSP